LSQRNTFISQVVEHIAATIVEARKAGLRDYRLCNCSLNDSLEDDEGSSVERIETIDQEDYLSRTGRLSRPFREIRDAAIDVCRALDSLPPGLRELCHRLKTDTVLEISREKGIPRGRIYESLKELRVIFEDAGLEKYL
jgi:RNA polymerase sigma-70 factor (ECF subfamily)